ncbi:MAG: 50S ribosomal protein L25/general stress protein Ctc [Actinomycetota bacterium]
MAELKLVAKGRTDTGKGVARKLRAAGSVPGVLYGHGATPTPLSVDARDLSKILHTGAGSNVLIDLQVDGASHLAMPREIQRDRLKDIFVHVDFLEVSRDEKITVTVPVHVEGTAPGVKAGGVLEHFLWEVEVECTPGNVPERITVDVSSLELGDGLKVANLVAPSGVRITSNPDDNVVSVVTPQSREVPEGAVEGAAAPTEGAAPAAEAAPTEGGEG